MYELQSTCKRTMSSLTLAVQIHARLERIFRGKGFIKEQNTSISVYTERQQQLCPAASCIMYSDNFAMQGVSVK